MKDTENETESKPAFNLGELPGRLASRTTHRGSGWIWILVVLQLITMLIIALGTARPATESILGNHQERVDEIRSTAIALEDRNLATEAAQVWHEYLQLNLHAEDRPEVLYRIGRLGMEAEEYSAAVVALIQAEQILDQEDPLNSKIGPKIVECLRRMGRYGEVGRELSRQVEVDADHANRGPVLATFAGEQFTQSDLDRTIERTVDRILAMQPEGSYRPTRNQLLKQFESVEARQRMLQEILQRELFSRRAREMKIDREETFRQSQAFLQNELLASQYISRELQKIQPTDIDIESFYTAQRANYRQPESVAVVVLPLKDEESAEEVLQKISSADDFRRLAEELTGEESVTPLQCARGRVHPRLGDTEPLFDLAVGDWTHSPAEGPEGKWLALVESKSPATTPALAQIRSRVEADYRRRKQQELTQNLFKDLASRYDVKILAMPGGSASDEATSGAGNSDSEADR